jgi:phosphoribosylanthranilate isomerase
MRVKICGITRPDDAAYAERCGADAIGVVMYSDSPRSVSPARAREIFAAVGPFTTTVAVSHTDSVDDLEEILALSPDAVQISHPFGRHLCGNAKVLRVIRTGDSLMQDADAIIVDESMGTGRRFDAGFFQEVATHTGVPVILAGGLTPENVCSAISHLQPYAVDVSSGVEDRPGIKNQEKVRAFIRACKEEKS